MGADRKIGDIVLEKIRLNNHVKNKNKMKAILE